MSDLDRPAGGVSPKLEDFPADRFDQCDGRSWDGSRCSKEAGHNPPCSFGAPDEEWPFDDDPPDPL
jgi:hypothetical protein